MTTPTFTTDFVAIHGRQSWAYYSALLSFYFFTALLYPLAYCLNQSFILFHPDYALPISICSPWNKTIHSFKLTPNMHKYLMLRFPRILPVRAWRDPAAFNNDIRPLLDLRYLVRIRGKLHGPFIRQGMLIYQGGHPFLIVEEFGRVPERCDLVATNTIAVASGASFNLYIPIKYIDKAGLRPSQIRDPFQETMPLIKVVQAFNRLSSPRTERKAQKAKARQATAQIITSKSPSMYSLSVDEESQ